MNKLALCIPAFNAAGHLPRLLNSAKKQLIPFDEIVVYDDCSTDNTIEIAESYGARIIIGDINRGCSHGKNVLANAVDSPWIHFHDADDELLPHFTKTAHQWIKKRECPDIVLFDYEYRELENKNLIAVIRFDNKALFKDPISYAIKHQINPFCGLYRKTTYLEAGGYDVDPRVLYNEDKAFHIRMAIHGLTFAVEKEISIINYRVPNSMSAANYKACIRAQYYVLKKTISTQGKKYSAELADELWKCAILLASCQNWEYVKKSLRLCKTLNSKYYSRENLIFRVVAKFSPFSAIWLREQLIRIFKPYLRNV